MSEDVVEIIETYPEIIEISDEECDENTNSMVIGCNGSADSVNVHNTNSIIVQEESAETLVETKKILNIEANHEGLTTLEQITVKQTKSNIINNKKPTIRKCLVRKRKTRGRGKGKTATNGIETVHAPQSSNSICHKLAKCATTTERSSKVIAQETSNIASISSTRSKAAENNNLENVPHSKNSSKYECTTSNSMERLQPDHPPSRKKNYDFSKISWLKPLKNLSSPPHLQLVIIDRGHPDWMIENDKWLMVEKRLLETLHTEMLRSNDNSIGLFDGAKWQRGIKIVGCHNKKALNFIKNFILSLDKLWAGAKLDVCTMANFVRQICKVFIPPPILQTDIVLSLIKLQNQSICCEDWEVLGEQERNKGVDLWLSINDESYRQICRTGGEIKYGINRIFVNPVL